jgi:hypothetical protein
MSSICFEPPTTLPSSPICGVKGMTKFVPADMVTEFFRSSLLSVSLFSLFLLNVIFTNLFGTGLPCTYTHTIDSSALSSNDVTCIHHWKYQEYNGFSRSEWSERSLVIFFFSLKFFFALLGNSKFHSVIWLFFSLSIDVTVLYFTTTSVPTFCRWNCFTPSGNIFVPQTSIEDCALLNCLDKITTYPVTNDQFFSWGILILTYIDTFLHLKVLFSSFLLQFHISNRFDEWISQMSQIIQGYPFHIWIGFVCNLFLGTSVSIASLYAVIQLSDMLLNGLGTLNDEYESYIASDPTSSGDDIQRTLDFLIELVRSIRLTFIIVVPICWVWLCCCAFYTLYALRRDTSKLRSEPPLTEMRIDRSAMYIGAYVTNCIFSLAFSWYVLGLFVFIFTNSYVRHSILSEWPKLIIFCIAPLISWFIRDVMLKTVCGSREKGIKYPLSYRFWDFMLFLNTAIGGAYYGAERVFTSLMYLLFMVQRVDWSILPAPFEKDDLMYSNYCHIVNLDKFNYELQNEESKKQCSNDISKKEEESLLSYQNHSVNP